MDHGRLRIKTEMNGIPTDYSLTPEEVKGFSNVFEKSLLEISILDSLYGSNGTSDYVKNVFQTSIEDLNNYGTLQTIATIINNTEEDKQKDCIQLQNDGQELCQKFPNGEQFLQQYQTLLTNLQLLKHNEEEIDSIIEKCTVDGEHTAIRRELENNYVDKWEKARVENFKFKFKDRELELQNKIIALHAKLKTEKIVDAETDKFLKYSISELEKQIEYWECKYKTDVKEINEKLENCRIILREKTEEVEHLKLTFKERLIIIEEHAKHKQKLEEEKQINDKKEEMATRIQAWWRGTMVRRRLGPYKHLMGPRKKSIKKPLKTKNK